MELARHQHPQTRRQTGCAHPDHRPLFAGQGAVGGSKRTRRHSCPRKSPLNHWYARAPISQAGTVSSHGDRGRVFHHIQRHVQPACPAPQPHFRGFELWRIKAMHGKIRWVRKMPLRIPPPSGAVGPGLFRSAQPPAPQCQRFHGVDKQPRNGLCIRIEPTNIPFHSIRLIPFHSFHYPLFHSSFLPFLPCFIHPDPSSFLLATASRVCRRLGLRPVPLRPQPAGAPGRLFDSQTCPTLVPLLDHATSPGSLVRSPVNAAAVRVLRRAPATLRRSAWIPKSPRRPARHRHPAGMRTPTAGGPAVVFDGATLLAAGWRRGRSVAADTVVEYGAGAWGV